jgi:hypothetical protein
MHILLGSRAYVVGKPYGGRTTTMAGDNDPSAEGECNRLWTNCLLEANGWLRSSKNPARLLGLLSKPSTVSQAIENIFYGLTSSMDSISESRTENSLLGEYSQNLSACLLYWHLRIWNRRKSKMPLRPWWPFHYHHRRPHGAYGTRNSVSISKYVVVLDYNYYWTLLYYFQY